MDWTGQTLDGRYRIERVLGRGGMGTAYLAFDERVGRRVVVKAPHPLLLLREGFRARFEREVRSLLDLEHPHVVKVLDVGGVAETPYVVLQYLAGGSLRDRLDRVGGSLAPAEVLGWLPHAAEALDFLHAKAWLHRDVKPANVLFDEAGHVFLSDFGIAKAASAVTTGITETGLTPGSPSYMAPECALGETLGPAYDQYALAVTVYEALSGKVPFDVTDPLAALVVKVQKDPRPLRDLAPHVALGIATAVMRALARDPRARYPSCAAFADAFREGLGRAAAAAQSTLVPGTDGPLPTVDAGAPGSQPSGTTTGGAAAPARGRRRLAVLAAVAGGVGLGVFALAHRGGPAPSEGARPLVGAADPGRAAEATAPPPPPRAADPTPAPTPPPSEVATIRIDAPAADSWQSGTVVHVTGIASGQGTVVVSGIEAERTRSRFEVDVPLPNEGDVVLEARVERNGVARATDRRAIRVDRTPPEVTITSPADAEVLDRGPVRVVGRATDASGAVNVVVDGAPAVVAADGAFAVEVAAPEDAVRDLRVVATDAAGQRTERTVRGVRWRRPFSVRVAEAIAADDLVAVLGHGRRWIEAEPAARATAEGILVAALDTTKAPAERRAAYAAGLVELLPQRTEPRRVLVAAALAHGDLPAARRVVDAWVEQAGSTWGPAAEPSARLLADAVERGAVWKDAATAAAAGEALRALLAQLGAAGAPVTAALARRVEGVATGASPIDAPTLRFLGAADPRALATIREGLLASVTSAAGRPGPATDALLAYARASTDVQGLEAGLSLVARDALEGPDAARVLALAREPALRGVVDDLIVPAVRAGVASGTAFGVWSRLAGDLARAGRPVSGLAAAVARGVAAAAARAESPEAVEALLADAAAAGPLPAGTELALRAAAVRRTKLDAKDLGPRVARYAALAGSDVAEDLWEPMFFGWLALGRPADAAPVLARLRRRGPLSPAVAARAAELDAANEALGLFEQARQGGAPVVITVLRAGARGGAGDVLEWLATVEAVAGAEVRLRVTGLQPSPISSATLEVSASGIDVKAWDSRGDESMRGLRLTPGVPTDGTSARWVLGDLVASHAVFGAGRAAESTLLFLPRRRLVDPMINSSALGSLVVHRQGVSPLTPYAGGVFAHAIRWEKDLTLTFAPATSGGRRLLRAVVALDAEGRAALPGLLHRGAINRVGVEIDGRPSSSWELTEGQWSHPIEIALPGGASMVRFAPGVEGLRFILQNVRIEPE